MLQQNNPGRAIALLPIGVFLAIFLGAGILFGDFYAMVTGRKSDGFTPLEISYSLGLSIGIILFYNHLGKRNITTDPSPVAVEMRTYEDDVNRSIVEMANREQKTIDIT